MVVEEILHAVPLPKYDPRPGHADPEQRAKRKKHEKENPHFNMQEFGMKAGVLALMGALALYPWEKEREEHVDKHHPERLERHKLGSGPRDGEKERRKSVGEGSLRRDDDDGRGRRGSVRGSVDGGGRRDRRMSVTERSHVRPQRYVEESSRRGSVGPGSDRESRRATRPRPQRRISRSVDPTALRMAVAEGYSYIPPYAAERRSMDDWEKSPRTVYDDGYVFRPQRAATDDRRMRKR